MYRLPNLARVARVNSSRPFLLSQKLRRFNSTKVSPEEHSEEAPENIDVPWYLRQDVSSPFLEKEEVKLPSIPDYAPAEVRKFCDLMANSYGMSDILLFDMTELDESHDYRANNKNTDFIIICSGKSEKHNFKAAGEFRYYLKHEHDYVPHMEGMTSGALSPVMRRRLLRRASRGPPATHNDYGMSANSWIFCQHQNIDVHILTKERREELNLESMWCKPEDVDKYISKDTSPDFSDHIFSGIRRFHTSSRVCSSSGALQSQIDNLTSLSSDSTDAVIKKHIDDFEAEFHGPTAYDHNLRFKLYKTVHLARPSLVTFEHVEKVLLEKYASLEIALDSTLDLAKEKSQDVTEYVKLLIDSPEWNKEPFEKIHADRKFQKLSSFIRMLYCFSNDTFAMTSTPDFLPLVWRLSCHETLQPVTSKQVDEVIDEGVVQAGKPGKKLEMATYDADAVLELIAHHYDGTGEKISSEFEELLLFTYGNADKWDRFWNFWNETCFLRLASKEEVLRSWLRLVIFLSLTNNKNQILHLFNHHWDIGGGVGGTVITALRENGGAFSSEKDCQAFKAAVESMLQTLGTEKFEGVQKFIALI